MTERVAVDASKVEWRRVAGEIVILELAGQRYVALNASATVLWPYIVDGCDRAELQQVLANEYGLPGEDVEPQINRFLDDLASRGLIEISKQDP